MIRDGKKKRPVAAEDTPGDETERDALLMTDSGWCWERVEAATAAAEA